MERMSRRWRSLSRKEVQKLVDSSSPEKYASGGLANGEYMPEFSKELISREFTFCFDNFPELHYKFTALHELEWTVRGKTEREFYQGHELENGLFFVQHMIKGSNPAQCHTLVIDTNTSLVTLCAAAIGNDCEAREVSHTFYFGVIEGASAFPAEKHHFTSDLVGKAISWTYHDNEPPIKHIYTTEYFYTYVMIANGQCWVASNPADFIKINDHIYIFTFIEERQAGVQGFFLINLETMHDIGSFMGINSNDIFECYTVGAKGMIERMETYIDK